MKEVIIVGHGLAGAILAHTLIDRGLKVCCSEGKINYSASRIATGLINPFIGPKLNIPFEFKRCTEVNFHFFKKWEEESNEILLKPEPLLRVFKSKTQRNKWDEYTKNSDSARYTLSFHSREKLAESEIMGKYGAGETQAFRLNVEKFLKLSRQKLESMDCWTEETFKHNNIKDNDSVFFAEGYNVSKNPYFNWLPFAPAQGEILEFTGPESNALSNGTWFLPNKKSSFHAGSTWKHTELKSGPTKIGHDTILRNLEYMPISRYKKVNHYSGIRSGTLDRNPIIGRHPRLENLYIFNGFGSRGSTTIKLYADHLAELFINGVKLPMHVDLNRFTSLLPNI